MNHRASTMWIVLIGLVTMPLHAQTRVLDGDLHHLRIDGDQEWAVFPEQAEGEKLVLSFTTGASFQARTLHLRQQDVKQVWRILLDEAELGTLHQDENHMTLYRSLGEDSMTPGSHILTIEQVGGPPDDIRVGAIVLYDQPVERLLSEATVELVVMDEGAGQPVPARITVVNAAGALQPVGAQSNDSLAVRPGILYTGTGTARFGLPAGAYTIYAGRGFEYGVDSTSVSLEPGDRIRRVLRIRREVPTEGYVSSDPHVHTLTFSGHGDATAVERMLTIAGEGIELPVATEHNQHAEYESVARETMMRRYFTPVAGNEVTTPVGHFNVFPVEAGAPVPDPASEDWPTLFDGMYGTSGVSVVILNHGRDIHSGYRPFGAVHHHPVVGANLDGWTLRANAMEVINSSAQQADMMQLYRDWFALLNHGYVLTPVGSSDSHDVGRHFVGQARTFIQAADDRPGQINVAEAVEHFLQGRVSVSLGLLTEISVNGRYGPGDLAPTGNEVTVTARVLGPGWVTAERIELYQNGRLVRSDTIRAGRAPGVKWSGRWTLPAPGHDVHLVAIARGPGVDALYWPVAKPYQADTPTWNPEMIGSTGAVWLDGDGDGRRSSALAYAEDLIDASDGDLPGLLETLASYDAAVAAQAAYLLEARGWSLTDPDVRARWEEAAPATREGFERYLEAEAPVERSE